MSTLRFLSTSFFVFFTTLANAETIQFKFEADIPFVSYTDDTAGYVQTDLVPPDFLNVKKFVGTITFETNAPLTQLTAYLDGSFDNTYQVYGFGSAGVLHNDSFFSDGMGFSFELNDNFTTVAPELNESNWKYLDLWFLANTTSLVNGGLTPTLNALQAFDFSQGRMNLYLEAYGTIDPPCPTCLPGEDSSARLAQIVYIGEAPINSVTVSAVPIPSAAALFPCAIALLGWRKNWRNKNS